MSAALQSAPSQPTVLPSTTASRQYSQTQSPNREIYYAHHRSASATTPTTTSKRPPSRRTSGASQVPFDPNAPVTSRSAAAAAAAGASRASDYHKAPGADRSSASNATTAAPQRSPSTANQQHAAQWRNSEKMSQPTQHRPQPVDASRIASRGGEANGAAAAAADSKTSRRSAQGHHQDSSAAHPSAVRDGHPVESTIPIRTNPATTTPINTTKTARDANETPSNRPTANGDDTRANQYAVTAAALDGAAPSPASMPASGGGQPEPKSRSRHDHSRSHKSTTKFGDFILGNTIGEGEFGKVKLGWKQDSNVQVAIKLIKRDSVGANPSRLAKIKREVTILRGIHHPNIVKLIDMVETDRYIGIILEYASGGELFDYILNHRYLKDNSARRLFSQLISGVGYLHKKGIVHRDLKLENLLLDRNRNIIITDFGFANTFDAHDELTEEEELNLSDREFVKRFGLDKIKANGTRKGDLMQTSCGSPCYAAPELVVSDSLYTGRKVDVWSCGVILYAMLAGYLPFDDDPANPEGDNINLLYKYIVTTPLTFPEYVSPHARDLLRRILVPNPRKRADLFEVARHSWLSEYAHVVEFITSSTTSPSEVHSVSATTADFAEGPLIARSASVREAPKTKSPAAGAVGGLAKTHGKIDGPGDLVAQKTSKDNKRRTVQVEYVAPITQTQRGAEGEVSRPSTQPAPRYRPDSQDPSSYEKPQSRDAPATRDGQSRPHQTRRPLSSQTNMPPITRQSRDMRAHPESGHGAGGVRPQTGNSSQSATSLALKQNYGQPAPPTVADTNAQGRIQQPSGGGAEIDGMGRPNGAAPPKISKMSGVQEGKNGEARGHKRSSTIGDISSKLLGRNGSVFGRKGKKTDPQAAEKSSKKYPPISMANTGAPGEEIRPRQSIDSKSSRRSFSFLGKKRSGSLTNGSQDSIEKKERRRFSLLPASFTLKGVGLGRDQDSAPPSDIESQQDLPIQDPPTNHSRGFAPHEDARSQSPFYDDLYTGSQEARRSPVDHRRYKSAQMDTRRQSAIPGYPQQDMQTSNGSGMSVEMRRPSTEPDFYEGQGGPVGKAGRGVLQKQHKRFTDAYDQDQFHGHEGSSGAAKRVMDFFRRRSKARGGDDR